MFMRKIGWLAVVSVMVSFVLANLRPAAAELTISMGSVETVAGTGVSGYDASGGAATSMRLRSPSWLAFDNAINSLYISDELNEYVWKVTPDGLMNMHYYGIGGFPQGIALDGDGHLIVVDRTVDYDDNPSNNFCGVYKVDDEVSNPILIAGGGVCGSNITDGNALAAQFYKPTGVAIHPTDGSIYISDELTHTIRKISGGSVTRVAGGRPGTGDGIPAINSALNRPKGLAFGQDGTLYIVENGAHRIRKISPADGKIYTVNSGFGSPRGIAINSAGTIYVSDSSGHTIKKIRANGTVATVAGTGTGGFNGDGRIPLGRQLNNPLGIAFDAAGRLYVADMSNYRARRITFPGTRMPIYETVPLAGGDVRDGAGAGGAIEGTTVMRITTVAGTGTAGSAGDGGPATAALLNAPASVATGPGGDLFISDNINKKIRKVSVATGIISVAGDFSGFGVNPAGTDVDNAGNIYVAIGNQIHKFTPSGAREVVAGTETPGFLDGDGRSSQFRDPEDVAVDPAGNNIYVADTGNNRIRKVSIGMAVTVTTIAGTGAIGVSGDGRPAREARLWRPLAVAVDPAGNVYISDFMSNKIRVVNNMSGIINTLAGTGEAGFSGDGGRATDAKAGHPRGITIDAADGSVYFTDTDNQRIRKIAPPDGAGTRIISTVAGNGAAGYSGDGGLPESASLNYPVDVAIGPDRKIYIADSGNFAVRMISSEIISDTPGSGGGGGGEPGRECGNGTCDALAGETQVSCPADCPAGGGGAAVCGNGTCDALAGETQVSCPADCPAGGGGGGTAVCGNGTCDALAGETQVSCPADCPAGGGGTAVCGNGICETGEAASCQQDCAGTVDEIKLEDIPEVKKTDEDGNSSGTGGGCSLIIR